MAKLIAIRATIENDGGAQLGDILSELEGYELTLEVPMPGSQDDGPDDVYTDVLIRFDRIAEAVKQKPEH